MIQPRTLLALAACTLTLAACHRQPMLTTPASEEAAYAELYPDRLRDVRARFEEDEAKARKSFDALRTLPKDTPASDADEIEELVKRADAAGRSQHYVDEALRQEEVRTVVWDGKGAIRRRIAGSVAYAGKELAKKKGQEKENQCLTDEDINNLSNTAATGTDRAVERQLEGRLRERNPAQRYLHAHSDLVGPQRLASLERQVDLLSRASYVAHVRLELYRQQLDTLLEQERAVRTTLDRDEAEGRGALESTELSKSERVSLEEQITKDEVARGALDAEVNASKSAAKDLETRAAALKDEYQALLTALINELEQKRASAPPAPVAPAPKKNAPKSEPKEDQPKIDAPASDPPESAPAGDGSSPSTPT